MKNFSKVIFLLLIAVFASRLVAQGQPAMTPLDFNDKLSAITESLYTRGQQWGKQFTQAYKTRKFSDLRPHRESLDKFVTLSIAQVKAMKDVKNSQPLRMAMIKFLEFEKRMVSEAFKPFEDLKSTSTDEEIKVKWNALNTYSAAEKAEMQKLNDAQMAYGKANGFTFVPASQVEKP